MPRLTLRINHDDSAAAQASAAALAPDDPGSIDIKVEGNTLIIGVEADALTSLLRTADDVLVCLRAANP